MSANALPQAKPLNRPVQVLFASLIGTAVEFFDFYIYATAAVLVFPALFFPKSDPASAILASLATFAIAFIARPRMPRRRGAPGTACFLNLGHHSASFFPGVSSSCCHTP